MALSRGIHHLVLGARASAASVGYVRTCVRAAHGSASGLITTSVEGKIATITLNAPSKLNALTVAMGDELGRVLDGIDYEKVGALIITGAGKAFSAGGDFDFLNARARDSGSRNAAIMRGFYDRFIVRLRAVPVPTLAAINGPAIGAGLCFALGADLRIAAKSAKLGVTFVGLGLHPGMGATYFLPRLVGPQIAARMCLTAEVLSGEEAARDGLVLEACDDDQVLPRTRALAEKIVAQGPVAVRSCVRSLRLLHDDGLDRALWREADAQSYCYSGPDLKEGVAAVAGKRKPAFTQLEQYKP